MRPTISRPHDRLPRVKADRGLDGPYFRELAKAETMTAEEELAAGVRIARSRESLWHALLGHPPFTAALVTRITEALAPSAKLRSQLAELEARAREYRDKEAAVALERFTHLASRLAANLSLLDIDAVLADELALAVGRLLEREHPTTLRVPLPPRGSRRYSVYAEGVRVARAEFQRARNDFVRRNLRLVVSMARRYRVHEMSLLDLVQEGNLGLLKAVTRFDPSRGHRFSTYGSWWIRHAINRGIMTKARTVRVPVHVLDYQRAVQVAVSRLASEGADVNDTERLAELTGIERSKLEDMSTALLKEARSLDDAAGPMEGPTRGASLADTAAPSDEVLSREEVLASVEDLFGELRPIEAKILAKRFGLGEEDPMTLRAIGEDLALSRERIRQLQEQALGKLRQGLSERSLLQ